jgi:hypothetical protein
VLGNTFSLARLISRSRGRIEERGEGGSEGNRTFISCRRFRDLSLHFRHNPGRIYWRWNRGGAAKAERLRKELRGSEKLREECMLRPCEERRGGDADFNLRIVENFGDVDVS